MSLFGGSSKSQSTTSYSDASTNVNQTADTGDFLASTGNSVAGGDIYNTGLSETMVGSIFDGINEIYGTALNFVSKSIGTQSETIAQASSSLSQAYNSEAASLSQFKTYAVYGLIGWLAFVYFSKKR